jgi:tetratricopeptide (TPR) repeat protein
MERTKYFIITFLLAFCLDSTIASYKSDIYKAYISSNMEQWKKIMDEMNQQKNKSNEFVLELLNYQYGYIAWSVGNKKYKQAEEYLKLGEENINILEKKEYKLSLINSYKSAFYGFKIGLNKLQAPFIGPKSVDCANQAIKLDSNNPYGYIQLGNTEFYMPSIFGGSKIKAIDYYEKALKLMEKDVQNIKEDWNYLSLMTQIALAYQEIKYFKTAKAYFDKILLIEPNFKWVKEDLYPAILKKIK